jgi:hypothetical protein
MLFWEDSEAYGPDTPVEAAREAYGELSRATWEAYDARANEINRRNLDEFARSISSRFASR